MTETPYAQGADLYWRAGWTGILPLPAQAKKNPPSGYTGSAGRYPTYPDIAVWVEDHAGGNIALRMPPNVIGLDVDNYGDKQGGDTVTLAEAKYGPLPPTWRTTSRDDGISGIRMYRVPEGLAWPGEIGPATEIIQRNHRYALVWPSLHPEGRTYRWISPDGIVSTNIPDPNELPELPIEWVTGITGGLEAVNVNRNTVAYQDAMAWFATKTHATEALCSRMQKVVDVAVKEFAGGSAHNPARNAALAITRLTDEHHHGGVQALIDVRQQFVKEATRPERAIALHGDRQPAVRTPSEAAYEWSELVASAVGLVTANPNGVDTCDCYGQITGLIAPAKTEPAMPGVVVEPEPTPTNPESVLHDKLKDGEEFILNIPDHVPTIWGEGDDIFWAEGEALMIVGPPGVGKTTLTTQVVRGLLGLQDEVLGLPVARAEKVLYLAMDRPSQIRRAMARSFNQSEADVLREKIQFWQGPPPGDFAKHPDVFLALAQLAGASHVIVDSLKDAAVGLSEDETGSAYNRARQKVLAAGIQVLELHHMVKRGANGSKPTELADVYGSGWLTAGCGSVVLLWGAAGDPIVELRHLKQPVSDIGPWRLQHDHEIGKTFIYHGTDFISTIAMAGAAGITAKQIACQLHETDKPTEAQIQNVRDKVKKLINQGHVVATERPRGPGLGGKPESVYSAVLSNQKQPETLLDSYQPDGPIQQPEENVFPLVREPEATRNPTRTKAQPETPPLLKEGASSGPPVLSANEEPCRSCGVIYIADVIHNGRCPECTP